MKKLLLIACLCYLSFVAFAQEEKTVVDKPASSEMTALQTAASLAKYGYATFSPTSLIEAARIFGTTKVQDADLKATRGTTATPESKDSKVSFDPAQLLADAIKFAGKDKTVLALVKKVEAELASAGSTRGAVGGPKGQMDRVLGKDYNLYEVKFWSNELAEVCISGDGDTDLDLYVYDSNGNLIGSDTDYTDECVVRWVPAWTGAFTIKVVNRGALYNEFAIWTN